MKIAMLISGGVDSSVALKLLKQQGHEISAFYLKIWLEDELHYLGSCPWEEDLNYVTEICKKEKVPLHVVAMQTEYFDSVVSYVIEQVKSGRTPNPDIMCNNNIKFGLFLDKIDDSYHKIATGHYAGIQEVEGRFLLKKNPDPVKDQTYFLANLKQEQLKKLTFPLADLTKKEVRELAAEFGLPNKNRKDSQGICFLGKLKYNDFLKHYLGEKTGDIIDYDTNKKIGEHNGYWFFTIGQRKGIKLSGGPYYIVDKNPQKNIVYVSKNYHDNNKKRDTLWIENVYWHIKGPPTNKQLQVKLRHSDYFYDCQIIQEQSKKIKIKLSKNDQGIAPGQFAVFYDNQYCIGAGEISNESKEL
jgi:tRNA-5-taurinomethyluridine 2-sulfurtransferase